MNDARDLKPTLMGLTLTFALAAGSMAACSSTESVATSPEAGAAEAGAPEVMGEAEYWFVDSTYALTANVDTASCDVVEQLLAEYPSYSEAMTNTRLRDLASTRFKPVLDFMSRKLCNEFGVTGDVEAYKREALANSPAGDFLSGTPLLQALVTQSSDLDALLEDANRQRSAEGLDPIIVADYPNSVVSGPSTIVFFPGWPGRPQLDQWLQVQRTIGQMFFVLLEPREDGTYTSSLHSRDLRTSGGTSTIGTVFQNTGGTCLNCHYSGKPLRPRPLDDNPEEAAKVATLVQYLDKYPPQTNYPEYNPFPDSPGIGTGGKLTLAEAATYAGRTLTEADLATLNKNTACDSCHNGTVQNPLRPPLSETVRILTENGIMPPGAGIVDESQRTEAIRVLNAAYKVKLQAYFDGQ